MAQSSMTPRKPEYHHYIPPFLLQNFAHSYEHSTKRPSGFHETFGPGTRRWRQTENLFPGQSVLNVIDLKADDQCIFKKSPSKTMGVIDMYRDRRQRGNDEHNIQAKLSILEKRAAVIIEEILSCLEDKRDVVRIRRPQRDLLRKFIFIMKYRNSTIYRSFNRDSDFHCLETDRKQFEYYMKKKGFEKPVEVWLDNIKAMLEVDMDPVGKWLHWLMQRAYPDDAMWFFTQCQTMYLTLCTPSSPEEEFILTENAYSIHEGPDGFFRNAMTSEKTKSYYTEFHIFAPVSPRLMIVLRSSLLPRFEDHTPEHMMEEREKLLESLKSQYALTHPGSGSILEDLPVRKADTSYARFSTSDEVARNSKLRDMKDFFSFQFFPLSTEHTNRINFIMLENAAMDITIVFKSHSAMQRTIREYLCTPSEVNGLPCFKVFEGPQDEPRLEFLKKLERFLEWMDKVQQEQRWSQDTKW